jgi:hypothetical protein
MKGQTQMSSTAFEVLKQISALLSNNAACFSRAGYGAIVEDDSDWVEWNVLADMSLYFGETSTSR